MAQYKIGTVSVTNGSNVVTGSGTAWQTAGIDSSNIFTKEGDNVAYSIASVDSDTQITLTANYGGLTSSGSNYGITIDFTSKGLPLLSAGDLNTDAIYNEAMLNINNNVAFNDDLGTAAFADLTTDPTDVTVGRAVSVDNFQNAEILGLGVRVILKNDTLSSVPSGAIVDGTTGDLDITKITSSGVIQGAGAATLIGTWKNVAGRTLLAGEFGEFLRVT